MSGRPTLTMLAIDGTGERTEAHLALLRAAARLFPVSDLRLLTADPSAHDPDAACVRIQKLDYLGYSRFCVEELAHHVPSDFCLCVQLDGFVLNPELWDPRFLEYDYVGAPWTSKKWRPLPGGARVGNGGFSLRSRRFLEASASERFHSDWEGVPVPASHVGNEDYFLCVLRAQSLEHKGVRFAPVELARRFSLQSGDVLGPGHDLQSVFGFHGKGLLRAVRRTLERRGRSYPHLEGKARRLLGFLWA